jgi:glycosyltransferase involved in cell wall biosynthesis
MKIAYITTSLGSLSHTFIRREVMELRNLGMDISLFGIRPELAKELSGTEKKLAEETAYLYPVRLPANIAANIFFIIRKPFSYFRVLISALLNEEKDLFQHLKLIYHFFMASYLAFYMYKKGIQHIHAHFLNVPATLAMYCSRVLGIPFSITIHSAGTAQLKAMISIKSKLREAKFICAISEYNKEYISKHVYPCREKTYVVRCGINSNEYNLRSSQKLTEKPIRLLSIGRFVEKKGFKYLIRAMELLKRKSMDFRLTMIGNGPLEIEVKKQIKDAGLQSIIILKGSLPHEEVKMELGKSSILVAPSVEAGSGEKEGIPIVIMEAMASGVLVIATRHSGIPEIVKDKITGFLVPEKNHSAITEAIELARKDSVLRRTCINNARNLIVQEFNIKEMAKLKKRIFEENS